MHYTLSSAEPNVAILFINKQENSRINFEQCATFLNILLALRFPDPKKHFVLSWSLLHLHSTKTSLLCLHLLAVFHHDIHCCSFRTKILAHIAENFPPTLAGSASLTYQNLVYWNTIWLIINLFAARQLFLGRRVEQVADVPCLLRKEGVGEVGHSTVY